MKPALLLTSLELEPRLSPAEPLQAPGRLSPLGHSSRRDLRVLKEGWVSSRLLCGRLLCGRLLFGRLLCGRLLCSDERRVRDG